MYYITYLHMSESICTGCYRTVNLILDGKCDPSNQMIRFNFMDGLDGFHVIHSPWTDQ